MNEMWTTMATIVLILLWIGPGLLIALKLRVRRSRLVRCPETGGVSWITLSSRTRRTKQGPTVERCMLWPEKSECGQQCLTSPHYLFAGESFPTNADEI